jgi:hypothetical protein
MRRPSLREVSNVKNNVEQREDPVPNQSENWNMVMNNPDDSTHLVICEDCQMPYAPKYWPLLKEEGAVCYKCRENWMAMIEGLKRASARGPCRSCWACPARAAKKTDHFFPARITGGEMHQGREQRGEQRKTTRLVTIE